MEANIIFSIVIPCLNEADNIERLFSSIENASRFNAKSHEIILVDNGSTDATLEISRRYGVKKIVTTSGDSIARLRNLGAKQAEGEYLLFIDADMQPPNNWFHQIEHYFFVEQADAFGFVETIPSEAPWFAKIWSERISARRPEVKQVDYLPGRNICIRKDCFDLANGFDESLRTGEDKDFIMRVAKTGAKVLSIPGVDLKHWGYEKTLKELIRKEFWRQSSHVSLIKKNGFSVRLVRFPLLSVMHNLIFLCLLFSLFVLNARYSTLLCGLWLTPAIIMTAANLSGRVKLTRMAKFIFLYWLRFNVAGVSVTRSLVYTEK